MAPTGDRNYDDFLKQKVEIARKEMRTGQGIPAEEIDLEFAECRRHLLRRAGINGDV